MNKNKLKEWLQRNFKEIDWINENNVLINCPIHKEEKHSCKCHIDIKNERFFCDTDALSKPLKELFKALHQEYPQKANIIQINCYYYFDVNNKYNVTLVQSEDINGKRYYYRRPKGRNVNSPYNIQELIKASYENKIVVWVIGESKVELLRENKITAVTTINGANDTNALLTYLHDIPTNSQILIAEYYNKAYTTYFDRLIGLLTLRGINTRITTKSIQELIDDVTSDENADNALSQIFNDSTII